MYQFMVATTRSDPSFVIGRSENATSALVSGGEFSNMSLTSGTNKWASRAVVALQLAAWSAVGIVLLEKGISSLRRNNTGNENSSISDPTGFQVSPTRTEVETGKSMVGSVDDLSVIPLIPWIEKDPASTRVTERSRLTSGRNEFHDFSHSEPEVTNSGDVSNTQGLFSATTKRNVEETKPEVHILDGRTNSTSGSERNNESHPTNDLGQSRIDKSNFNDEWEMKRTSKPEVADAEVNDTSATANPATKTRTKNTETGSGLSSFGNRSRVGKFGNIAGGGAAAAVAMVAVGTVMLILGPAVIVLRALDERRQERRFLKLSGEDDLPPSYEQATGIIEQAPAYSSLDLDVISSEASS